MSHASIKVCARASLGMCFVCDMRVQMPTRGLKTVLVAPVGQGRVLFIVCTALWVCFILEAQV